MSRRMLGPWLAASVAWSLAAPVVAQEAAPPSTPIPLQDPLPSSWTPDPDWQTKVDAPVRNMPREHDVEMWSLALIGPVAILIIVTALGLTITVRSLRQDFRRDRTLHGYWQHGAMSRARSSRD